jgi:N-acyl-L-homoserine lactone synthetase
MPEQVDPLERVAIRVTNNAVLEASRFCVERCGLQNRAEGMAVIETAIITGKLATGNRLDDGSVVVESEAELPQLSMNCEGPKKRFGFFGKLVCRGNCFYQEV